MKLAVLLVLSAAAAGCEIDFTPSVEPLVLPTLPSQSFLEEVGEPDSVQPTLAPPLPQDPQFDPDDPEMWIRAIESRWEGVNVIACGGGEMAIGCQAWSAEELKQLYQVLEDYILAQYLDGEIVFVRDRHAAYAGQARSRVDDLGNLYVEIHVSDLARRSPPAKGLADMYDFFFPKDAYFQGTLAHELTHAAVTFHPELLDWWIEQKARMGIDWGMRDWRLGLSYDWAYYDEHKDNPELYERLIEGELFAMAVASPMYDPSWGY